MWEHEFICLVKCGQTIPPSPMEKAELINAGLGPRKLSLFECGVATSIVQGGYGLPVFHPAVYHYLTMGEYIGQVTADEDVPDPQVRMLLSEVSKV